jgi:hypothetical protein
VYFKYRCQLPAPPLSSLRSNADPHLTFRISPSVGKAFNVNGVTNAQTAAKCVPLNSANHRISLLTMISDTELDGIQGQVTTIIKGRFSERMLLRAGKPHRPMFLFGMGF